MEHMEHKSLRAMTSSWGKIITMAWAIGTNNLLAFSEESKTAEGTDVYYMATICQVLLIADSSQRQPPISIL